MRRLRPAALAVLALALASCADYSTSTLVISSLYYDGSSPVYLAVDYSGSSLDYFRSDCAAYAPGSAASPAVSFTDIAWSRGQDGEAAEYWLRAAVDTDGSGALSDGDLALPAMRVVLRPGETTTVSALVFTTAASAPAALLPSLPAGGSAYAIGVFMATPSLVGADARIYLRLGAAADLSLAPSATYDLPFADASLCSGLAFRLAGSWYALAWFDADGDGALSSGDYVSHEAAAAPSLVSGMTFVLSPASVYP